MADLRQRLTEEAVGMAIAETLARLAPQPLTPEHDSQVLLEEFTEQLQPRDSTPDVSIGNLPHWGGVTEPEMKG